MNTVPSHLHVATACANAFRGELDAMGLREIGLTVLVGDDLVTRPGRQLATGEQFDMGRMQTVIRGIGMVIDKMAPGAMYDVHTGVEA